MIVSLLAMVVSRCRMVILLAVSHKLWVSFGWFWDPKRNFRFFCNTYLESAQKTEQGRLKNETIWMGRKKINFGLQRYGSKFDFQKIYKILSILCLSCSVFCADSKYVSQKIVRLALATEKMVWSAQFCTFSHFRPLLKCQDVNLQFFGGYIWRQRKKLNKIDVK